MTTWQPTLDGLTLPTMTPSGMDGAAMTTLRRLDDLGLLDDRHTLTCQLILELAHVIGAGSRNARASAVAMAAKELREALATLPQPVDTPAGGTDWDAFAQSLKDA